MMNSCEGRITMWTRKELKDRAKITLKANYWKAVLVSLILSFLTGGSGSSAGSSASNSYQSASGGENLFSGMDASVLATIISVVIVAVLVTVAISFVLSLLVLNPLIVGCRRFFIKCREEQPSIKEVVFAFSHSYGNVIKTMFLQGLYIFLWSLLFIIPGIIKTYEYLMIPYILAENPEMDTREVFARSKQMMTGDKWNAFVLQLSFFGWILLSVFTCGILLIFYVGPYSELTYAELYAVLKQKASGSDSTVVS